MGEAPRFTSPSQAGIPGAAPSPDDVAALRDTISQKLKYAVGKAPVSASDHDWFIATALAARDRVVDRWLPSGRRAYQQKAKRVYYLSLEFLIGRQLFDVLGNLGLIEAARAALAELGCDIDRLRRIEPDAALGNGGLGRLAACFMESMATLQLPAFGYGIRYDHGLFRQVVVDGWQREHPEEWLTLGYPWEFERPELSYDIGFGGYCRALDSPDGTRAEWVPSDRVEAVAYDVPIVGWRGRHVNTLRLWAARAGDPLRLDAFNLGDHIGALSDRARAESISKVLYPADETPAGQELRLKQEYFFSSASIQDLVRRHLKAGLDIRDLPDYAAIQLNDTHPAIAVAELMRILVDVHRLPWKEAWFIVGRTFSYTNHTLLPEALERWAVPLMERLLPRHMQIIYLINAHFIDAVREREPDNFDLLAAVSLIDESHGRFVRMGHLAFLGAHRINGVSALHTGLMKETVFGPMNRVLPGRIVNKTNGITFRRWLFQSNPGLTGLLAEAAGPAVLDDAAALAGAAGVADDAGFRERFAAVKAANKAALAALVRERLGIVFDPDALFDVQIKRIHEYKRQLLNILEAVALYGAIKAHPGNGWVPRVKVFAGKAAASYHRAKLIIKLAHDVGSVINADPMVRDLLKVVFIPNYSVSLAELIVPAADLSEQISTAGMEASGTGNMKLALNGAVTIGTLDGANVEILDNVGEDNIFIFGLKAAEAAARRARGLDMSAEIAASPLLGDVLGAIASGVFSPEEPGRYRPLVAALRQSDYFLVCADFDAYWAAQRRVDALWRDRAAWHAAAIRNTTGVGWFSSDRTISEYAEEIWRVKPLAPDGRGEGT